MVQKKDCAYLCSGNCLFCKGKCKALSDHSTCRLAVRRAIHHDMRGLTVRERLMESAHDRFRCATEGVRGYLVYRSCGSKRRYKTAVDANKGAKRIMRRFGSRLRAYYCRFCHGYHLTSQVRILAA